MILPRCDRNRLRAEAGSEQQRGRANGEPILIMAAPVRNAARQGVATIGIRFNIAMYQAKRDGKNEFFVFDGTLESLNV